MSLLYGQAGDPHPDRLHVCKIGGTWVATFRGGPTERLARERGESLSFALPYPGNVEADVLAGVLRRQNPQLLVIVDRPILG